jgi:holo-[acyl-carrier protein] synthase
MILGTGIDIIKISRIDSMIKKWKSSFLDRIFTKEEIAFCMKKRLPSQNFAVRFAAKEAFLKALGLGMRAGIPWKDIEVVNNETGRPSIELHRKARETYQKNIRNIHLSLSHDGEYGFAQIILEGSVEGSNC